MLGCLASVTPVGITNQHNVLKNTLSLVKLKVFKVWRQANMIQRYFLLLQGIGLNEPMAFDAMRLNL